MLQLLYEQLQIVLLQTEYGNDIRDLPDGLLLDIVDRQHLANAVHGSLVQDDLLALLLFAILDHQILGILILFLLFVGELGDVQEDGDQEVGVLRVVLDGGVRE